MIKNEIRQIKKSAAVHAVLALIILLNAVCFLGLVGLAELNVVSASFFQKAFAWLLLTFAPAAILNAVLTLFWMIPIVRWQAQTKKTLIYRRTLLEDFLSK